MVGEGVSRYFFDDLNEYHCFCFDVIENYFGGDSAHVYSVLLRNQPVSFKILNTKCIDLGVVKVRSNLKIKRIMQSFVQHNLAEFRLFDNEVMFNVVPDTIMHLSRAPLYLAMIQKKLDTPAMFIFRENLLNGPTKANDCIGKLGAMHQNISIDVLKEKFNLLVKERMLKRVSFDRTENFVESAPSYAPLQNPFLLPTEDELTAVAQKKVNVDNDHSRKRPTDDILEVKPEPLLWMVDFHSLQEYLRDQYIIEMIETVSGDDTELKLSLKETMRAVLKAGKNLQPANNIQYFATVEVSAQQILFEMSTMKCDKTTLIDLLCDFAPTGVFTRIIGSTYRLNYAAAMDHLALGVCENYVTRRIDAKAPRILNLIKDGVKEQKTIDGMSLMHEKASKEITYTLLTEKLINMRAFCSSGDFGPSKSTYVFRTDPNMMIRQVKEAMLHAKNAVAARERTLRRDNLALITRARTAEAIKQTIIENPALLEEEKARQIDDVDAAHTSPAERQMLVHLQEHEAKCSTINQGIDRLLLIFDLNALYNNYVTHKKEPSKRKQQK